MFRFLIQWLLSTIAVLLIARIAPGFMINDSDLVSAMLAAVAVGFLNALLGAALKMISFPIAIVFFILFIFVADVSMVLVAAKTLSGFSVFGWSPEIWTGGVLAALATIFRLVIPTEDRD